MLNARRTIVDLETMFTPLLLTSYEASTVTVEKYALVVACNVELAVAVSAFNSVELTG